MLKSIPVEQVFSDSQCLGFKDINRKVGPVELKPLRSLVCQVAHEQGREINLPVCGYRSVFEPEMLDEPMKKFLSPFRFTPDRDRLTTAVSRVRRKLKGMGVVTPIDLELAHEWLLSAKGDKFAGLPTLGKKGEDVDALARAYACKRGKCPPPAVIGHRGKNTEVARPVWMFPFEWHICEGAYFIPLQEKFKRSVQIYAADNAVARRAQFNEMAVNEDYQSKLAMDYSGFDGSIGTQLIGIAFGLLGEHLKLDVKQEKLWNRIATYFATCPFVNQHGYLVTGRRGGVPSGSMFTQMVDTIVNAIVIEYALSEVKDKRYFVYGDDSVTYLKSSVKETEKLLESVKRRAGELGVLVNLAKTHVCEPTAITTFLGHYDLRSGRPADEVLARLVFPERPFKVSAESLRSRVVSYMAESDEVTGILLPVYWILTDVADQRRVRADIPSYARRGSFGLTHVELGRMHPRDLPGLAQFLATEDPTLVSSYLRIRAAV